MGAHAAQCMSGQMRALTRFGQVIGLLFQVVDDILDEVGDAEKLGKTTGKDAAARKVTFPALMGLPGAKEYRDELHTRALKSLDSLGKRSRRLRALCDFISMRDY